MTAETTPENALAPYREGQWGVMKGGSKMSDYLSVSETVAELNTLAEKCRRLEGENVELRGVGAYKFGFAEGYESGSVDIHKWIRRAEKAEAERDAAVRDAERLQWSVNNARWIRHEHEAYVAIPVALDADLSFKAARIDAIDAAMANSGEPKCGS